MDKQIDSEIIRAELGKLSQVIKQYKETGHILYNDIQTLQQINRVSRWVFSVLLVISVMMGVSIFYVGTRGDYVLVGGIIFSIYLMYNTDRLVIKKYLQRVRCDEARTRLDSELKQLREPTDIMVRINSYRNLCEDVSQVLKQVEDLGLYEDSSLTDTLQWLRKFTQYDPEGVLWRTTNRVDLTSKYTHNAY